MNHLALLVCFDNNHLLSYCIYEYVIVNIIDNVTRSSWLIKCRKEKINQYPKS